MARVELRHPLRGRVTDIASCDGHLDCVFHAIGRIVGQSAPVRSLDIRYTGASGKQQAITTITVEISARLYRGVGTSDDVLQSCALAYLEALGRVELEKPSSRELPPGPA